MTSGTNIEERLEEMTKRLERAERGNRAMKIWGAIAVVALIGFGSGPFASTVMAKKLKIPALIVAQEFVLTTSTGTPLAALVPYKGGAELAFLNGATTRTAVGFNTADGGGLASSDASGTVRTYVGTDPTGIRTQRSGGIRCERKCAYRRRSKVQRKEMRSFSKIRTAQRCGEP